jgi:hypothetical protein
MDRMLHRGEHAVREEMTVVNEAPSRGLKMLGMGKEFTRGDRIIYIAAYSWTFAWTVVFLIGTYINLTSEVPDSAWMSFWKVFVLINTVVSVFIIIWFAIGGVKNLREMLKRLSSTVRNHQDDGFVQRKEESTFKES